MSKYDPVNMSRPLDPGNPAVYRYTGCIECGSCVRACREQSGVFGREGAGEGLCIHCGQCAAECVSFALRPRSAVKELRREMGKGKTLVASVSPAVRVSIAESFGYPEGSISEGKLCSLLRLFGFDRVLDTNTAADITVMEESAELLQRIKSGGPFPMFTSCCPAWVSYAEMFYPAYLKNISSVKSPVSIQGATVKSWYARQIGVEPENIVHVAITPCTAKKAEILRPELKVDGLQSTDHVLCARELVDWAKSQDISFDSLPESEFDSLMSEASGAAALFGRSGGVFEAVLRTARYMCEGVDSAGSVEFTSGGIDGVKEAQVQLSGHTLNVAIIHGTAKAGEFLEQSKKTGKKYHFVEVMACPGGCVGGGGQPKRFAVGGCTAPQPRMLALAQKDASSPLRFSHHNGEVQRIYREFYGEVLSEKARKCLHTSYFDRSGHAAGGDTDGKIES